MINDKKIFLFYLNFILFLVFIVVQNYYFFFHFLVIKQL